MINLCKLPTEIIKKIIPYTYNLQNKNLLDDIINYTETKTILFDLYYKCWIIDRHGYNNEDKEWLINDIYAYANDYNATMFGYIDKFYSIFYRNSRLQTTRQVDNYIRSLGKKKVIQQINIFLGLLTIQERKDIIIKFPIVNQI